MILSGSQLVLLILSGKLFLGISIAIVVAFSLLLILIYLRGWKNKAARFESYFEMAQEKRDELTATNRLLQSDHDLLGHITANYALLTELVARGGQVVGAGLVSAAAPSPPDTPENKYLGSSENVFNPPPQCRVSSKLERHEQVMVLVITDEAEAPAIESTKFNVVVCYPQEALQKAASPNRNPLQQLHTWARIEVIRCEKEKYKIDIPPSTVYQSRGAMALAMRYVIDRARREGAKEIYGPLTCFESEAHRVRLYCFYIKKFGFIHTPTPGNGNGIIQKFL